jgi:hypothetical protein
MKMQERLKELLFEELHSINIDNIPKAKLQKVKIFGTSFFAILNHSYT